MVGGAAAERCDGATRAAEGAVPQAGARRRQRHQRRAADRRPALDGFGQRIADGSAGRRPSRHPHPAAGELPAGLPAAMGQQTVRPDRAGAAARPARRPAGVAPARRRRDGSAIAAADRRPGARQSAVHRGAGAHLRGRRQPHGRARRLPAVHAPIRAWCPTRCRRSSPRASTPGPTRKRRCCRPRR